MSVISIQRQTDIWHNGYHAAYSEELRPSDNPYRPGSDEHEIWAQGYRYAGGKRAWAR